MERTLSSKFETKLLGGKVTFWISSTHIDEVLQLHHVGYLEASLWKSSIP
jgi:hypothetical protein